MNIWTNHIFEVTEKCNNMNDHCNYVHYLSSCKIKAWKKKPWGLKGIKNSTLIFLSYRRWCWSGYLSPGCQPCPWICSPSSEYAHKRPDPSRHDWPVPPSKPCSSSATISWPVDSVCSSGVHWQANSVPSCQLVRLLIIHACLWLALWISDVCNIHFSPWLKSLHCTGQDGSSDSVFIHLAVKTYWYLNDPVERVA